MKFEDPELVLMSAFRYALGRRTYIVSIIVDEIVLNWNELNPYYKKRIKEEILYANDLGMDCDKQEWQIILDLPLRQDSLMA